MRDAVPELLVDWDGAEVPEPGFVAFNETLAAELGLDELASDSGAAMLAGAVAPSDARPAAMVYAGHQFGHYNPRLGDGRALLLGELAAVDGQPLDLHLKGSGRTPFARGGDGKAALGPMLREYLIAEAMHALGIPTTRSLAVVTTGEQVHRDGDGTGAVLARVASSHLRVGTFEYAARLDDQSVLRRLADYAIERHYPAAANVDRPYLALLDAVVDAQASLIAQWMLVGFIHGVMNTDNMTISGESIDYGPCAFVDRYDPDTVFSSIDHAGRYRFGQQPAVAQWNLTRFAETLIALMGDDVDASVASAQELLEQFPERFRAAWRAGMRTKLGLVDEREGDAALFDDLLAAMQTDGADLTSTFRTLSASSRRDALAAPPGGDAVAAWMPRWRDRLDAEQRPADEVADAMAGANPVYVPRNHLVEEALDAAAAGDLGPFQRLLARVTDPFTERPGFERYAEPAPTGFTDAYQTFCGT